MFKIDINIETLRKTKGVGQKTLERIIEQHELDNDIKSFKSEYVPSDKYKADKDINLWQGDCLGLMSHIPDRSVDMILADLPYGTTACSWDSIIPFEPLWSHYKRIIKDNGAIVLFGQQPFTSKLVNSGIDIFNHNIVWQKDKSANFQLAKYQPRKITEDILVFSNGGYTYNAEHKCVYNPQMIDRKPRKKTTITHRSQNLIELNPRKNPTLLFSGEDFVADKKYPSNLIYFATEHFDRLHPTQKPVELLEYLVKTYTDENMLVLDNTMGSGSTGVACKNTNRQFIGIELDEEYFDIAQGRINDIK